MKCKNCGTKIKTNFCSYCGQSSKVRRIDSKYLISEISNSVFQLDRGLLYTIKQLFVKPGESIRDFLNGQRKSLYKPISYFLLITAIYIFISYLFKRKTFVEEILAGFMIGVKNSGNNLDQHFVDFISKYQVYISLTSIPLLSLSTYLLFFEEKYNYFEHLIINLYINAQQTILLMILSLFFRDDNPMILIPIIAVVTYNFWALFKFFHNIKTIKRIFLILLSHILYLLEIFIIVIFFVFISIAIRETFH